MSECTCHKNYKLDTLIPKVGVITSINEETPDVKTFCVNAPELINLVAFAIKTGQKSSALRSFIFTHPSMSEGLNGLFKAF